MPTKKPGQAMSLGFQKSIRAVLLMFNLGVFLHAVNLSTLEVETGGSGPASSRSV